jgi:hypothetical protein
VKAILPKDSREAAKWISGIVATAATIIGALATLGVIGGTAPGEAVAHAAEKARDAGSSLVRLEMTVPGDQPSSGSKVEADGALDYTSGRGSFDYELTDPAGERSQAEVRFAGSRLYVRPPREWGLSQTHPWVGATLDELKSAASDGGADVRVRVLAGLNFEGMTGSLDYLKRIGDVEEAGKEVIGGDETTRYDGTVRAGQSVHVSVWIADNDKVLRRMLLALHDGTRAQLDFDKFGTKVDVREPPSDQVIPLADLPASF